MTDPVSLVDQVLNEPLYSRADVAAMLCMAKESWEICFGPSETLDEFIQTLPNFLIQYDPVEVRPLDNQLC